MRDSALTPPITYSATFTAHDAQDFARMASEPMHPRYYTRYGNPLHAQVAEQVALLEGAQSGLVFASGMGAIATSLLGLLKAGDHVIAQRNHYMGTSKLLGDLLARFGVSTSFVEQTDLSAWQSEFARQDTPATRLVMLESPTNPNCELSDIAAICALARSVGAISVVDNTFATPLNQQPIALGADLVVHSATKYLGGHHDLTAGVVVGSKALIETLWQTQIVLGATLSPMDAWLLLRGMKTLAIRVQRINSSALEIAQFLQLHPAIESVSHPGLASHPQHALACQQMTGFGGTFAIRLKVKPGQAYARTEKFVSQLKHFSHAVSLGGVDSLVVHAAAMWAGSLNDKQMQASGIEANLVRLSIGLEDCASLMQDLHQALS
jgi:cystathionine beta-lyase/cystathionine gamma-synthase